MQSKCRQPSASNGRTTLRPFRPQLSRLASSVHPLHASASILGNRAVGRLIQSRLRLSQPGSPAEHAADQAADHVMRMPAKPSNESPPRQQPASDNPTASQADGAQPLPMPVRAFFEPRFGYDFSQVRIHTGEAAAQSARSLNALAYTLGRDVVFGAGQYAPESAAGQRLLAHELAHVVQQAKAPSNDAPVIQRMEFGSGQPPVLDGYQVLIVPDDERPRVSEAIDRIREVAHDPKSFSRCHRFFADECNGNADTLRTTFDSAILWKWPPDVEHLGGAVANTPGHNIAYMPFSYKEGAEWLAGALVHELLHNCGGGGGGGSPHRRADIARVYCMGQGKNELTATVAVDEDRTWNLFFSYRRLIGEWARGGLTFNAGLDIDFTGILHEGDKLFRERSATELGNVTLGARKSLGLWGAERFGGIQLTGDIGIGGDRFKVRAPNASDPPSITTAPGVVLQLGTRIEFWVPDLRFREGRVNALSFEAAYRVVQPLTSDAQKIHEIVFGVGGQF